MTDSTASPVATLPDKLSALIRVAVADMRKVQADERYTLDAWEWHTATNEPGDAPLCAVCMAGAVIAGTLGTNPEHSASPDDFAAPISRKLEALDSVRCGELACAAMVLAGVDSDNDLPEENLATYETASDVIESAYRNAGTGFATLESYEQAADILEKAGL